MVTGGDTCTHYHKPNKPRQIEQQLTKAGDEVVENGEEKGLGLEWNEENGVYRDERRKDEDGNVQPVEVVEKVVPLEWRQGLLIF